MKPDFAETDAQKSETRNSERCKSGTRSNDFPRSRGNARLRKHSLLVFSFLEI